MKTLKEIFLTLFWDTPHFLIVLPFYIIGYLTRLIVGGFIGGFEAYKNRHTGKNN